MKTKEGQAIGQLNILLLVFNILSIVRVFSNRTIFLFGALLRGAITEVTSSLAVLAGTIS